MTMSGSYDFESALKLYYKRCLFPFKPMYDWFSYSSEYDHMSKREWSFTIQGDIYIRFQSYSSMKEWQTAITDKNPLKIDIGPIYTLPPKNRANYDAIAFQPVQRELIFDIDMDEYNSVRTCCTGTNICDLCWRFMVVAIKVIHTTLTTDFGFKHILWVFSGRRGVHCWVCDEEARKLSVQARASIVDYLSVIGGEGKSKKVELGTKPLHPAIRRSYKEVVKPIFENHLIEEQNLMEGETCSNILSLLPFEISKVLQEAWEKGDLSGKGKWMQLKATVKKNNQEKNKGKYYQNVSVHKDIAFQYSYPRLDVAVSKGLNHLLKSPFCAHPKTGKICVPIDPMNCDKFSPNKVPTLSDLVEDVDRLGREREKEGKDVKEREKGKGWKGTRLQPYVKYFQNSFLIPMQKDLRASMVNNNVGHDEEMF